MTWLAGLVAQRRQIAPIHALLAAGLLAALLTLSVQTWPVDARAERGASAQPAARDPAAVLPLPLELSPADGALVAQGDEAKTLNRQRPIMTGGLQTAPLFQLAAGDRQTAAQAQTCLAAAMYYEAGFEGEDGRLAVGQVVLNRVRHPAFPHDVCGVVFERSKARTCQFTFYCDGALVRPPAPAIWHRTMAEAAALLAGKVYAPVGMATHYHADYVLPYWAPRLDKIAVIGAHIFYRWPGQWGRRNAFGVPYAEREPGFAEIMGAAQLGAQSEVAATPDMAAAAPARPMNEREGGFIDPSIGWVPKISQGASESAIDRSDKTD